MKKIIAWDITSNCNLRCKHCYNANLLANTTNELNLEQCLKFIDKIPSDTHLHILGGEPFAKSDILQILDYITVRNIPFSLVTNGLLIDKYITTKLCNTSITNISFSLDGATKNTHEAIRGKNTFERLIENILLFKQTFFKINKSIDITVNVTINNINYTQISQFYKLLEQLNVNEVVFNRTAQEGNALVNNINIENTQWIEVCESIAIHSKNRKINTVLFANPLLLSYLNTCYDTSFLLDILACGILKNKVMMYVKHDGIVYPCNKWYSLIETYKNCPNSSVLDMSRKEIEDYPQANYVFKDLQRLGDINNYKYDSCKQCSVKNMCYGCILNFYDSGKIVNSIKECEEVKKKINAYKDSLDETLNNYFIEQNLAVESFDDKVVIINTSENRTVTLKGILMDVFYTIYSNLPKVNSYSDTTLKSCLYELKRLRVIKGKDENKSNEKLFA